MVMKDNQGLFFALKSNGDELIDNSCRILNYQESSPVAEDKHLSQLIERERSYLDDNGFDMKQDSKEVDYILHWKFQDNRKGYYCSFKQSLRPDKGSYNDPERNPVQIAYDHPSELEVEQFPIKTTLKLTLSPLLEEVKEMMIKVEDSGSDLESVTWHGVTE